MLSMQAGKHNGYQEHVASYYAATRNDHRQWPELSGELDADVCIIGGGFTGLNTYLYSDRNKFQLCKFRRCNGYCKSITFN